MPLKSFSKTFGMDELKKGYFPHDFKKKCDWDYVGPMLCKKYYGYNQMKPDGREKFLKWYDERVMKNTFSIFKKKLSNIADQTLISLREV